MNPTDPVLTSCSLRNAWRLAVLVLLASLAGCAAPPKETVDYGYGMQFAQPLP